MKLVSRRSFLKLAGVTALAVVGASALSSCGSSQILLPLHFDIDSALNSDVIDEASANTLKNKPLSIPDGLGEDQQKKFINQQLQNLIPDALCEVDTVERLPDYLDGKESEYLYVTLKHATDAVED